MHYDYIIAGSGCAGYSLAMHMLKSGLAKGKKILMIDREEKRGNDRTWCFWERETGLFEEVVCKTWETLTVKGEGWQKTEAIAPYRYKMIRSKDFYNFCRQALAGEPAFTFLYGTVVRAYSSEGKGWVEVGDRQISAGFVFCSILFQPPVKRPQHIYLLQHFKGRFIETSTDVFDPSTATLMDFAVPQFNDTAFVYVLPLSRRYALVEFTVFGAALLHEADYDRMLDVYIQRLGIADYRIIDDEFGVIPMTTHTFPRSQDRIVYLGTAGGVTKPSTGYTFRFIQEDCAAIAEELTKTGSPRAALVHNRRYMFYDRVLLYILDKRVLAGRKIFEKLFMKNSLSRVLQFLENKTSIWQEVVIFQSLQKLVFMKAAIKSLFVRNMRK